MHGWQRIFAAGIVTVAGLATGCRSGISVHGKSCGLFVVPMYKQPAGYSSTYHRHLLFSPPVVEHVVPAVGEEEPPVVVPAFGESVPASSQPACVSDADAPDTGNTSGTAAEVELLPAPNGPETGQQPAAGIQLDDLPAMVAAGRQPPLGTQLPVRPTGPPVLRSGQNRRLPGLIEPTP